MDQARDVFPANDSCYNIDAISGRCVADGGAGARIDLMGSPSVDIANGAPSGLDATNEIVDAWGDGSASLNAEVTKLSRSSSRGYHGVFRTASIGADGVPGAWSTIATAGSRAGWSVRVMARRDPTAHHRLMTRSASPAGAHET